MPGYHPRPARRVVTNGRRPRLRYCGVFVRIVARSARLAAVCSTYKAPTPKVSRGTVLPRRMPSVRLLPLLRGHDVQDRVDEAEVGEGLGEVAEVPAAGGVD